MGNTEDGFAQLRLGRPEHRDGHRRTSTTAPPAPSQLPRPSTRIRFSGGATHTLNAGVIAHHRYRRRAQPNQRRPRLHRRRPAHLELRRTERVRQPEHHDHRFGQITGNIALTKAGNATLHSHGQQQLHRRDLLRPERRRQRPNGSVNLNTTGANGTTVSRSPATSHLQHHRQRIARPTRSRRRRMSPSTAARSSTCATRPASPRRSTRITFRNGGGDDNQPRACPRANAQATSTLSLTGAHAASARRQRQPGRHFPGFQRPDARHQLAVHSTAAAAACRRFHGQRSPGDHQATASARRRPASSNAGTSPSAVPTGMSTTAACVKSGIRPCSSFGCATRPPQPPSAHPGHCAHRRVQHPATASSGVDGDSTVLGTPNAITTVQNGAVLLLNNTTRHRAAASG